MKASEYIVKNMSAILERLEQLEKGYDLSKSEEISIRETIEKFSCRYQEDDELQAICDEFMEYLENRNHNSIT